jgi:hypothetical protein
VGLERLEVIKKLIHINKRANEIGVTRKLRPTENDVKKIRRIALRGDLFERQRVYPRSSKPQNF